METIRFIGVLSAVWLFTTGAGAIQWIKGQLKLGNLDEPKWILMKAIRTFINCSMCTGFWAGYIYYDNFLIGCITSIAAELFTRIINIAFKLL